jgi:predicted metallo-beta-lactamase superfamily hydrolase
MKFNLGDRVQYKSSRPNYDFMGTVIGISAMKWHGRTEYSYMVQPDVPQASKGHVHFSTWQVYPSESNMTFLSEYFQPINQWGGRPSKEPVCWFGQRTRNLTYGMVSYVPTQEGDKDDDI